MSGGTYSTRERKRAVCPAHEMASGAAQECLLFGAQPYCASELEGSKLRSDSGLLERLRKECLIAETLAPRRGLSCDPSGDGEGLLAPHWGNLEAATGVAGGTRGCPELQPMPRIELERPDEP